MAVTKPYTGIFPVAPAPLIDTPGTPSGVPTQQKKTALQNVMDILGSDAGKVGMSAVGAGLQSYQASKDRAQAREDALAGRQQNADQFAASMLQRQNEDDRAHQLSQATAAANAAPLGADQEFAQKQALLHTLLGGARNVSITPGDPRVAAAMGKVSGGIQLPEGGFDPAMLERLYGDKATLASIQNRGQQVGQLNPHNPVMDYSSMFGEQGGNATNAIVQSNNVLADQQSAEQAKQRELIMRAIDEDIRGEKQAAQPAKPEHHGNIFGTILKGLGTGASFIPGVGQVVAPIATGLGGLVNGDGLKSSIVNAGLSALPAGLGKVAKGAGTAAKVAKVANAVPTSVLSAILGA